MTRLKTPLILATAGLVALGACTQPNRLTDPNNPNRNAEQGALTGAALGALVGIARGDNPQERRRGAIVGAAIGAGAGGLIGNQLDRQEAELRRSLGNDQVAIVNTGDRLIVTLPQDILFATDSAVVRPDLRADLRTVASSLQSYPNTSVRIIGHTDNVGTAEYNQSLSLRRANAVADVLFAGGVSGNRITTAGRGEEVPVATNLTPEGRAQNRRVEIIILPNA